MTSASAAHKNAASIGTALAMAGQWLERTPALAAAQASEILKIAPGHPQALLIRAAAHRRLDNLTEAAEILRDLAATQPAAPAVHYEWGLTQAALGDSPAALASLRHAVALKPAMPDIWRAIGDVLTLQGDPQAADAAYAESIRHSVNNPRLLAAAAALCDGKLPEAETMLRDYLKNSPTDVAAIRMLAELGTRLGRNEDAERLLRRALELSPSFTPARHNYAIVLFRQNKAALAIAPLEKLLAETPSDPNLRNMLAACLGMIGDSAGAVRIYADIIGAHQQEPRIWLNYGHVLRADGQRAEAVRAYRRAITLAPSLGDAYWSLANLKTEPFDSAEIASMRAQLTRPDLASEDRFHLHFALGRALEMSGDFAESFANYAAGAQLRRASIKYSAAETTDLVDRTIRLCTPEFFARAHGAGCQDPAPIFVVGLPRSGSTLIEQILASHSQVEGTLELPEIPSMARELGRGTARYPGSLADLPLEKFTELGTGFIERTQIYRRLGRVYFIDKMPNNWAHVGLIHLMLPNAKIIDARRHPMATCFSAFKQHFARGQHFSYDLTELGAYYTDYVRLMRHMDEMLPGRIHRVQYESMVADTEAETRRLLACCGLEFEPACLRFWETARTVRTASSEQVRKPIFAEGLDHWRNFEPWLEPLRAALGPDL